ncbi:MAG: CHASE2 domain-containing protein, partial [Spirochaetota bacterium]
MKNLLKKFFSKPTPLKRIMAGALIGLIFTFIIIILYFTGAFKELEFIFMDFRTTTFTDIDAVKTRRAEDTLAYEDINIKDKYKVNTDDFVIDGNLIYLLIDDTSLLQLEKNDQLIYPWPRDIWAHVSNFLYASEIKSLVYDLSFLQGHSKYDEYGKINKEWSKDREFAEVLYNFNDTTLAATFTRKVAEDQFAQDIKNAQNYFADGLYIDALIELVLAYFNTDSEEEKEFTKNLYNELQEKLKKIDEEKGIERNYRSFQERYEYEKSERENVTEKISKYRIANFESDNSVVIDTALDVEPPMDVLIGNPKEKGATDSIGDVKLFPDQDGVARKIPTIVEYNGQYFPSLALAGVIEALQFDISRIKIKIEDKMMYIGNEEEAKANYPLLKDELLNKFNEFKPIANQPLNQTFDNIILFLNSVDYTNKNSLNYIEELLKNIERDIEKLKMLNKFMNAYSDYVNIDNAKSPEAKKNIVDNFELMLNET